MKSEELVPYLMQFVELEDKMTIKLTDFLDVILKNSDVSDELKRELKDKLEILTHEGNKHLRLINEIKQYVNESEKDEF